MTNAKKICLLPDMAVAKDWEDVRKELGTAVYIRKGRDYDRKEASEGNF